ncbi:GNAT family N-acetyltransferase [Streptomyces cylindrosporus]|uniref:GNAT family N-acetyltransferase n=1 Tax=Streptomyces cylindrosporus TaxID=2927583 RepID=A0ABS9Y4W7_9ACTN|nr:GNAT family N-acetyltransferase [Streptomyces cylindrosporus]MCI3272244.1 GNAT family N-acetyltransferase [Streptomyces cylindrosporus]
MEISIREGEPDDIPVILGLFDGAVEWLVAQGRTGQWGSEPWSRNPRAVAMVERYVGQGTAFLAEYDGVPAGTLTLTDGPGPGIPPAEEPERYVHLLASDRRLKGHGIGAALLARAADETRRSGISLLRVDCYAGGDGKLVRYYESNGFTRTETFVGTGDWPGQVLEQRL